MVVPQYSKCLAPGVVDTQIADAQVVVDNNDFHSQQVLQQQQLPLPLLLLHDWR